MKTLLAIIGGVVVLVVVGITLAVCADDDEEPETRRLRVVLIDHDGYYGEDCDPSWGDCGGSDYGSDYSSDDRNRNRGRNRGAFSPGPFDRSPIDFSGSCISLNCSGRDERQDERQRR